MRHAYLPFLLLVVCSFLLAAKIMVAQAAISTGLRPFQLAILGNVGAAIVLLTFARYGPGDIVGATVSDALPRPRHHQLRSSDCRHIHGR